MFENTITWACHICGEKRPDMMIGVAKHDTSAEFDLPPGTMTQNVRYCRDRRECIEGAREFRFMADHPHTEDVADE